MASDPFREALAQAVSEGRVHVLCLVCHKRLGASEVARYHCRKCGPIPDAYCFSAEVRTLKAAQVSVLHLLPRSGTA